MVNVIREIRSQVADVSELKAVYAASETGADGLPDALNVFPVAVVLPGADVEYILHSGQHRHTYEVGVQVFEGSGDLTARSTTLLPLIDRLIEEFTSNVSLAGSPLGALVTYCLFRRQGGFEAIEYGGIPYLGYEITLEVSEEGAATPATGSPP